MFDMMKEMDQWEAITKLYMNGENDIKSITLKNDRVKTKGNDTWDSMETSLIEKKVKVSWDKDKGGDDQSGFPT